MQFVFFRCQNTECEAMFSLDVESANASQFVCPSCQEDRFDEVHIADVTLPGEK